MLPFCLALLKIDTEDVVSEILNTYESGSYYIGHLQKLRHLHISIDSQGSCLSAHMKYGCRQRVTKIRGLLFKASLVGMSYMPD